MVLPATMRRWVPYAAADATPAGDSDAVEVSWCTPKAAPDEMLLGRAVMMLATSAAP
jgi:hypothetical protein